MTPDAWFNNLMSLLCAVGGVSLLVAYTVLAPWWRSRLGRAFVVLAASLTSLSLLSWLSYAAHLNTGATRLAHGILIGLVACNLYYQTWYVVRTQLGKHGPDSPTPTSWHAGRNDQPPDPED